MSLPGVRRTIVHLRDEAGHTALRLNLLLSGRVRLCAAGTPDLDAETIEDLTLLAAASELSGDLYHALLWELDLLALRGDSGQDGD